MWLTGSWCSGWASGLCLWGGRAEIRTLAHQNFPAPCNIKWWKFSQRSPSQCYDPAPLNDQQATVLDTPCQTTSKTGTQPHPLPERLPKIILSLQTPQNPPPDTALPTRKTRSSPTHQIQAPVPSTRKPTQALNQPHPLRADTKNNRNYEPGACEKETPNRVS